MKSLEETRYTIVMPSGFLAHAANAGPDLYGCCDIDCCQPLVMSEIQEMFEQNRFQVTSFQQERRGTDGTTDENDTSSL